MAYVKTLFNTNFLEYASYVIKDRAIPDLEDGLKPVQRRILHTLFEMDDGKFHKVANIVGATMKYHPHGDASIYSALVVLANKDLFIEKQGNFGNIFTGDDASAPRYIECRLTPIAKDLLYDPELTRYADSYDGRNREPVVFPAKIPVSLVIGAEGIAVGMSTRILPHNLIEVLEAEKKCLMGKKFSLYPDFPTGGLCDVSGYGDGNGKVLVRAKLDTSDPKRIVITELPFGSTTESLIASIENAAKKGYLKIQGINDFTTDKVEIEIKLARGVYTEETVDALYAYTDCEQSLSVNLLVIRDRKPSVMTVTEIIQFQSRQLLGILKAELELERKKLEDRYHALSLEQIFIEERIYKRIEEMKTQETVIAAVISGFKPFASKIRRAVTQDDVERLLKIPIRRISLYDINRAKQEMKDIKLRLKQIADHLASLTAYAIGFLDGIIAKAGKDHVRRTKIGSFQMVDVKEVAQRNQSLRYDEETGYLGTSVSTGRELLDVSEFDRILVMRHSGVYAVVDVPEKLFVDKGMWYCSLWDRESPPDVLFTVIYADRTTGFPYIKRCRIEQFILNKDYLIVPEKAVPLLVETRKDFSFTVKYKPKPKIKIRQESFKASDFAEKGLKALGTRIASRIAEKAEAEASKAKQKK
jgi:topoisomerase IV subunit A